MTVTARICLRYILCRVRDARSYWETGLLTVVHPHLPRCIHLGNRRNFLHLPNILSLRHSYCHLSLPLLLPLSPNSLEALHYLALHH